MAGGRFRCSWLALALLLGGSVGAADGNPGKPARWRCWITFHAPCTAHPELNGRRDDSEFAYKTMGVGDHESNCLDRAQTYWEWCGQELSQQVSSTFASTGKKNFFPPDNVAIEASDGVENGGLDEAEAPAKTLSGERRAAPTSAGMGGGGAEHVAVSQTEGLGTGWQHAAKKAVGLVWRGAVRAASLGAAAASETLRQTAPIAAAAANTVMNWTSLPGDGALPANSKKAAAGQRSWVAILLGGGVAIVSYMGLGAAVSGVRRRVRALFVRSIDWDTPERARVIKDPRDFRRSTPSYRSPPPQCRNALQRLEQAGSIGAR